MTQHTSTAHRSSASRNRPLTSPQREIWFDQAVNGNAPLYNIGGYMDLSGSLDVALFRQSASLLVQKHDALRTVLCRKNAQDEDGVPEQVAVESLPVDIAMLDFSSHANPREAAMAWMRQRFAEPFGLQGEPLFRYALIKLGEDAHLYFACYHHLIADGWSIALLTRSHAEIYTALQNGEATNLDAPAYDAFIDNDLAYTSSPVFSTQRQYWMEKFQSLPDPMLVPRHAVPAPSDNITHTPSACSSLSLPRDWYDALSEFARNQGATSFHAILAAVYVYFTRTAHNADMVLGLPVLNRAKASFKATAGLFVGISAARFHFDGTMRFAELIKVIGRELRQDYRHQRFPVSALNRELGRVGSHQAQLFEIGVSYERHDYEAAFGPVRGAAVPMVNAHQTTPLMLYVREFHDDEAVQVDFVYNRAFFTNDEIREIQQRLVHLLDAARQAPDSPLNALPVLTPAEAERIREWNATLRIPTDEAGLLELIGRCVERKPDHPAVIVGGETLSYRELDAMSNRLAHYLIVDHSVQPDTLVGVCMERSIEMIVAVLGILKAGGAYVPLNPAYPAERLQRMIDNAGMRVLLTHERTLPRLPAATTTLVCVDKEVERIAVQAATVPNDTTQPDHLAYMIYTSGSTGEPKGVMVSRANLLHSTRARLAHYRAPVERFLMLSPLAFDSSVAGLFWTLCDGGTLHLPAEAAHNDALALVRLIERHAISHLLCIPSFHALLLEAGSPWQLASLSAVIVAGEACGAELVERHTAILPQTTLFNEYGPTEGSVWSTVHHCLPQRLQQHVSPSPVVPIGRPIGNVQIHLLDGDLEPAPLGVAAEIYISGDGVTRGYLGRPDATAEKFLPCPFTGTPGARMYQSGDLGRWLPDGSIEYLGRIDHQVKIRGFRIELTEIESVLLSLPAVREAAVLAREDSPGGQRLVAYVVLQANVLSDADPVVTLKDALRSLLPQHMVPDHFMLLPQMPLTPNGKVDRKALPAPQSQSLQRDHIAPRTRIEHMLADIWRDLLKCNEVGLHDNFFELGGHSLLGAQCISRVRKQAGVEVPLRLLFDHPVLQEFARRIESLCTSADSSLSTLPPPVRAARSNRDKDLPLSFAQQRLWFLDQMESGNVFYNMAGNLELRGALNASALQGAIDRLIARHEVLRTGFDIRDGEPVQIVPTHVQLPLCMTDLSAIPPEHRLAEARRLTHKQATATFDLRQPPLLRMHLLRLDVHEHWLVLNMHHAIADGWSTPILLRDLAAFYNAEVAQAPAQLPALPLQYADFAAWQRALVHTPQWHAELSYWCQQLAGAPALLELPTDHGRPATQSHRGAHIAFTLPEALVAQLHALSNRCGATLFMTLLGAFGLLLSRYSGQDDICIGTPIANRQHAEFDNLIGCFVNTLVMRLKPLRDLAVTDYLQQVRETALGAYAHQNVPFEQVVDSLEIARDLSHAPLFQVMFALHQAAAQDVPSDGFIGLHAQPLELELPVAKFDLTLNLHDDSGHDLRGSMEYNTDLFDAATIVRMVGHFRTLLEAIVTQPAAAIGSVELLTPQERGYLLDELNRTEHAFPLQASYASLFAKQVARHPDRIAAVCMNAQMTYRELDKRSTRIARALVAAGAGPEVLVGVLGERSLCFLTMMIAIFKAGAVYVPLDVNHPASRLGDIVARSRMRLLLASQRSLTLLDSLLSGLTDPPRTVIAEALWLEGDASLLPPVGTPDDLAYVIFTSGSTGRPKGAMVEQRSMLNNLYGKVPALGLGPGDRVAQTASPAFDISVWQFLAAPLLGGTVHILPDTVAHDPQHLLDETAAQQITVLQVVPSMMRHLVQASAQGLDFSLRWVLSIGEALPPDLALAWFARFPAIPLINIYGPAECADNVAFLAVRNVQEAQAYRDLASVPIGRPTANNQLFILDARLQPVPLGVTGEICVTGTGVGRGYLHDPDTSAAAFVPHPFQPGARFYRTGDLGRYRPDGTIDYLGRRDHQIKIRGHRIELGEIESRLRACTGVHDAAVIARKDRHGEMEVFACWVPSPTDEQVLSSAAQLRRELAAHLPQSMVPAHFLMLDTLPVNANGKIDRKALAAMPLMEGNLATERSDTPSTATEHALHGIWSALLAHTQIGRDDNFFHLGGHSLLATRVMARVRTQFDCDLPLRTIFEAPTLRELAARIDQTRQHSQEAHAQEPPLLPVDRSMPLPLSFSQQRLWFLDQLQPGLALYNMPGGLHVRGDLDIGALEDALNDLVARHEVLRTTFDTIDSATVQCIADADTEPARVPFSFCDLTVLPALERESAARHLAGTQAQRPFDLRTPPMLRAHLLRLNAREHWLLLTMHHIASDAWSTGIVVRELAACYRARRSGTPPSLPALPVQYADYAVWQRARLQEPMRQRQLAYWRERLNGAPALLDLPTDHPRPAVQSTRGGRVTFEIDPALTAALHALCRSTHTTHTTHTTLFVTLSAAFALLLSRYSGQSDICIGTPVTSRQRQALENLIGFFVNTLVLRLKVDGQHAFTGLLEQTRETVLAAHAHQDLPFEQLVEALQPERHPSHSPLFQVMFVLENVAASDSVWQDAELRAEPLELELSTGARFDLTLHITERKDRCQASLEYNADLFEHDTIARMGRHYCQLLQAIIAQPELAMAELPLLSEAERHQLLVEWNRTSSALPAQPTIHAMFEACVQAHPDRIAVVFQGQQLTYAALNARANRVAHTLQARGIAPDELVGICAERSLEMIIAVLGVLKAGGAYLPLDPTLPASRMAYMLNDAQPCVVLTQPHLLARLPQMTITSLCLDADSELFANAPEDNPSPQTQPDHLAYVIYTSGSTGKPKGTLIHHRGLVNLVQAQRQAFDLHPGTRVLQWASFNFDVSVSDIFTALTSGAQLHLASSEAVLPGQNLLDTLRRHRIELVALTVSSLAAMPVEALPDLKTLVVGGEHCDLALIAPWVKRYTVINAYGPTEATVCATVYPCAADGKRHPPIGRPLANTQIYILDACLNPVPIGVTGELYIGGEGLARGYLGRPDLTAERFIQNPFSAQPGARMYQTGDLARYLPSGHVEYVGRVDHQIKIRGYRIELGEVELALTQLDFVHEAVVLAQNAPSGGKRLVAYVVPTSDTAAPVTSSQLRAALQATLPDYMVPSHFTLLDRLPVNTNGKIDRIALGAMAWVEDELVYVPSATPTEERLAALWSELLARERVGRDENFFHIGGHSLLAVRMMARIKQDVGIALPLSQLFLMPTIAALAAAIDEHKTSGQIVVPMAPTQHTAAQQTPLWLIHPAGGTVFCYRKLAERFHAASGAPVQAIQSPEIAGMDCAASSFDDLCRLYTDEILRLQPDGPVHIAGWSLGGAIAFGVAGMLEQQGRTVRWVGMFDTVLARGSALQRFEDFVIWAFTRLQTDAFSQDGAMQEAQTRIQAFLHANSAEAFAQQLAADPDWLTSALGLEAPHVDFLRQQHALQQAHIALMTDVVPGTIRAPLHIFRAEESVQSGVPQVDWLAHTSAAHQSTQQTLPGHHDNVILLDRNIEQVAQGLTAAMRGKHD